MDMTILRTCVQIYQEARVIVQRTVKEFILDSPPRIIGRARTKHGDEVMKAIVEMVGINFVGLRKGQRVDWGLLLDDYYQNWRNDTWNFKVANEKTIRAVLNSRSRRPVVLKFVGQASRQLWYGQHDTYHNDLPALEIAKEAVGDYADVKPHWDFGGVLLDVNSILWRYGIAVGCVAVLLPKKDPAEQERVQGPPSECPNCEFEIAKIDDDNVLDWQEWSDSSR
jgi:hypothetical protein